MDNFYTYTPSSSELNTGVFEFNSVYSGNTTDVTQTSSGSGVHNYRDLTLNLRIQDRDGQEVTDARDFLKSAFLTESNISILEPDGTVAYANYQSGYKQSSFTFTEQNNIDIFGFYAPHFGIKTEIKDRDDNATTSEFYFYGNRPRVSSVTVTDTATGHKFTSSNGSASTQVLSGTSGQLKIDFDFLNSPEYTNFDHVDIYWASGSTYFNSNPLSADHLAATKTLFQNKNQSVFLYEENIPQFTGSDLYLTIKPYSTIGLGDQWTVGPFKFEYAEKPNTNYLTEISSGDVTGALGFTPLSSSEAGSADNFYLTGVSKSNNTFTFHVDGASDPTYELTSGDVTGALGFTPISSSQEDQDLQNVLTQGNVATTGMTVSDILVNPGDLEVRAGDITLAGQGAFFNINSSAEGIRVIAGAGGQSLIRSLRTNESSTAVSAMVVETNKMMVQISGAGDPNSAESNESNEIGSFASAILLGTRNKIFGDFDGIVAGTRNVISGNADFNFIGAGSGIDILNSDYSSSIGGVNNDISGSDYAVIGGGKDNSIVTSDYGFIGGGLGNTISGANGAQVFGSYIDVVNQGAVYLSDNDNRTKQSDADDALFLDFSGGVFSKTGEFNIAGGDFSIDGLNGRLFGVTDEVTGTVFSVNDAAGLPIVEVESTSAYDKITMGEYGSDLIVLSGQTSAQLTGSQIASQSWVGQQGFLTSETDDQTLDEVLTQGNVSTQEMTVGKVEAEEFIGNLRGAVSFTANAGETLTKGDVVYISGVSGNKTVVAKADADDSNKMPAFGVANETVNANADVTIINFGAINNLDTDTPNWDEGDELYVSNTAGTLSKTAPSGEGSQIQKMAKVTKRHASTGSITIMGAGRTNAVPNLNEGRLFVGNSSNQAVADDTAYIDIANSRVGIGTTTPSKKLHVVGTGEVARFESDSTTSTIRLSHSSGSTNEFKSVLGKLVIGADVNSNSANSRVSFNVDGSEKMRIATDGNVGIGTTSPEAKLHVDHASDAGTYTRFSRGTTNIDFDLGAAYAEIKSTVKEFRVGTSDAKSFHLVANNSNRLTILSDGNVGIGTSSPGYKLSVKGISSAQFEIINSLNNKSWRPNVNGSDFYITETGVGNPLVIKAGGNVGIGTTSPSNPLHLSNSTGRIALLESTATNAGVEINSPTGYNSHLVFQEGGTDKLLVGYNASSTSPGTRIADTLEFYSFVSSTSIMTLHQNAPNTLNINSSGEVGIGTTSPSEKLFVAGSIGLNTGQNIKWGSGATKITGLDGSYISFTPNNSEKVRFLANGNVGIGTTSPTDKLTIQQTTDGSGVKILGFDDESGESLHLSIQSSGNSRLNATRSINIYSGDSYGGGLGSGSITGVTWDAFNQFKFTAESNARIPLSIEGAVSQVGDLFNITSNGGSAGDLLTVDSAGNVGIGTTSPDSRLHVVGSADSDAASLGSEIVASQTASGTNWSGSSIATGYTHTAGSTDVLLSTLNATINKLYRVEIETTNVTAGRLDKVSFGGVETTVYITNNTTLVLSVKATSTGPLTFECQSAFVGTVTVSSVKEIVASDSLSVLTNSGGNRLETRVFGTTDFFLGDSAGENRVSSSNNIGIGNLALQRIATAGINLAIGNRSLSNLTNGQYNVAIGHDILGNYQKNGNVYNIGIGNNVMDGSSMTGQNNIMMGFWAGANMTSASHSLGIGYSVFGNLTSGSHNIALGENSLGSLTTGGANVAIGNLALYSLTTSSSNTAIGYTAGRYAVGNVANQTASQSVYIGHQTKAAANAQSNQIVIGYNADGIGSNTVTLGNDSIVTTALKGNVGIGTTSPTRQLEVSNTGDAIIRIAGDSDDDVGESGDAVLEMTTDNGGHGWTLRSANIGGGAGDFSLNHFVGGSESTKFLIERDGNVGIGTNSPNRDLQIGDGSSNSVVAIVGSTAGLAQLALGDTDDDNYGQIILDNSTNKLQIQNGGGGPVGDRGITLDSSQKVGIGTASPASLLHISSSTSGDAVVIIESDTDNNNEDDNPQLQFKQDGGNTIAKAGLAGNAGTIFTNSLANAAYFGNDEAASLQLYTNATAQLTIESGGNVGIGTTNPSEKLDVSGNAKILGRLYVNLSGENSRFNSLDANGPYVSFRNNGTAKGYIGSAYHLWVSPNNLSDNFAIRAENRLDFGIAANVKMTLNSSGNFGIGTTGPEDKLDIVGNLRVSSNKTANTNKTNRIRGEHYDIAEEPHTFMFMNSFSNHSTLYIGGGSTVENAATSLKFYTAANNTTTAGTLALTIDSSQNIDAVGSVTAYSFIKDGGANSEFLKADGSVDSNTYLTTGSASSTYLPLTGGDLSGNINLDNNVTINLGANNGLQLYHNGSHSLITNQIGDLYIRNQTNDGDIRFQADDGLGGDTDYLKIDGGAELNRFLKNTKHGDNVEAIFGDSADLKIYHDGSNSFIDNGTGNLTIDAGVHLLLRNVTGESLANFYANGANELFYDNSKKFETTTNGIVVTGSVVASAAIVNQVTAATSGGSIKFKTNSGADKAIILDNGNFGIGTNTPSARLELKGSTADTTANAFVARDSASASLFSIRNDGRVDATGDVVIGGDLTVNGTTSTINSTTLQVDDKNIELGTVATPTDTTADGGGITLKGATDKTINWVNLTSAWTFSERVAITPDGSPSVPAITFSGDTDTGLLRFASGNDDTLGITTGGTLRAQFNPSGIVSSANVYSGPSGQFRNFGGVWKATTGATGNGFQFISPDATALTISSTGDTVASGKITSGNDIVNATAGVYTWVGDTDTYIQRSAGNEITIKTGASNALVLDSSQNATFAGNIIALTGGASGNITVGRNTNEKTVIDVEDYTNSITAYQDADLNAAHNFVLNRVFGGTGANDFIIQKDGTAQFTLDTSANATFAGSVAATNLTLTNLSTYSGSQFTALMIDGGTVGKRDLGSNAFNSTAYLPLAGGALSGDLTLNGDVTFGGTAKKVIINSKRNVSLPAIGTKMRILTLSNNTFVKVFIISSENSYVEPIELDIHYNSAGNAAPVIHRVNNYTWHVHSNDIAFSSDSSGHVYIEKLSYTTGRNVRVHIVEQYQGSASLLDGSTTTTANTGSDESNIGKFGTITAGTWNGGVIASAYLDTDTAHLTGTQTFTGAKTFGNITSSAGYKANIAESSDADNITSNNIKYGYLANAASNKPVSGNSQYASVGNITLTHYDAAANDDFYIRAKAYNGNSSWAKIFTDQNSSFLPLSAGSGNPLTGNLYINDSIPKLIFTDTDTSTAANISANSSNLTYTTATTARDHIFKAGTGTLLTIEGTGDVGIGTTSVDARLHVTSLASGDISNVKLESTASSKWAFGIPASQTYFALDDTNDDLTTPKLVVLKTSGNVGIGTTTPSAKLEVNGHFAATTKSFIIDNPDKGGRLQYGVVETDEHSVYVRGKSDQEVVELPEEWDWLVHEDSVTVQLTSVGQMQQLFVVEQNNKRIKVSGLAPNGQYNYVVHGTRKDVDALEKHLK